jgi:hypothetical protein
VDLEHPETLVLVEDLEGDEPPKVVECAVFGVSQPGEWVPLQQVEDRDEEGLAHGGEGFGG